jgi:ABC-2 type transport system permease protein
MILAKAAAVLKKDMLTALRYRNGFVFALVAPAAQLATFYYMARAVGPQFRPEGMPYFLFLLVGTGFYTFLLAGIHSFLQAIQESQQAGTLEVLMTTSTPPAVLLLLSTISAFAGGFLQLFLSLSAGILLLTPVPRINLLGCAGVFFFSVLICSAIGLFAAGLQVWTHKGSAVLWLVGSGAWLMAGALFPVAALPWPVRMLSALLPFTHSLTGMRLALLQTPNAAALTREIEILILFALFLVPLSVLFFSWTVRRARQFGTLSFY